MPAAAAHRRAETRSVAAFGVLSGAERLEVARVGPYTGAGCRAGVPAGGFSTATDVAAERRTERLKMDADGPSTTSYRRKHASGAPACSLRQRCRVC